MSADYPEEHQPYWEHSRCCCHHSPQKETEAERTQGDGADLENIPEDAAGGGDAEEAEDLNKDDVREPDVAAVSEEDVRPESDSNERADVLEQKEGGRQIDLGVPEEELPGVLKELELSLKMTSMMEQEKMEDLSRPTETETSCSAVRRRNKRRRAKKASH